MRDVRERALLDSGTEALEFPSVPDDPVLSPAVRDLMRRGNEAEADGRLAQARGLYYKPFKAEPRCFSCALRRRVVERRIREESVAALEAGARCLEEARYADAATQYEKVLNDVPDARAQAARHRRTQPRLKRVPVQTRER